MQRQDIENLLPAVYQSTPGSPLDALLEVSVGLLQPVDELLDDIDHLFDPRRTPETMLPFLARWVDLDRFLVTRALEGERVALATGSGHLRELCAAAAELSRERGTRKGLLHFLEVATGCQGFRVEENTDRNGNERPFHLLVTAPQHAQEYEELIHAIVSYEKPAYVTYSRDELSFE
jgi:phage tail-like protein